MNAKLINQYRGINPHLHGLLLAQGKWAGFHHNHISEMVHDLNEQLAPKGYVAEAEPGLQIYYLDELTGEQQGLHYRKPDVGIRSVESSIHSSPGSSQVAGTTPTLERILLATPEESEEAQLGAVAIRTIAQDSSGEGQPVAWFELLSPANKPGGSHFAHYMEKRQKDILDSGQVLIEIDYLHHLLPVSPLVPAYGTAWSYHEQSGIGTPYYVLMEDPRPPEGIRWSFFGFEVEADLPTVTIPLLRNDQAVLNLGKIYTETIWRYYAWSINYRTKPLDWETYLPQDQDRIAARMLTVVKELESGILGENREQKQPLEITEPVEGARFRMETIGI